MSFAMFSKEKTRYYAIKKKVQKDEKNEIFAKGLTHAFGRKMAILPTFCFRQCRAG